MFLDCKFNLVVLSQLLISWPFRVSSNKQRNVDFPIVALVDTVFIFPLFSARLDSTSLEFISGNPSLQVEHGTITEMSLVHQCIFFIELRSTCLELYAYF